jgi:transposase
MHGFHTHAPAVAGHSFKTILAIDLGKFNSVLCIFDPRTAVHSFADVQTTPQALHDLLAGYASAEEDPAKLLVVMETCDVSGWVYDLTVSLGFSALVANPSSEAWKWKKVKRKTDRDDALKLAKLTALSQLPTVHMPPANVRQRRRLIRHRKALVERRTIGKNQIRSIHSQQGLLLPRDKSVWSKAGIAQLRESCRPIIECDEMNLWRGRLMVELDLLEALDAQIQQVDAKLDELGAADKKVILLRTVPGVGPRLAETVVACLDDVSRFKSANQVGSYAGLVPKQMESGTMKRIGRITRAGSSLLRGMLVEVAWMVYRHNAWAKSFVLRVSRGMKTRRRIAIVALARKLLVKLWAMLRDGTAWRDPGSEGEEGRMKCEDLAALGRV